MEWEAWIREEPHLASSTPMCFRCEKTLAMNDEVLKLENCLVDDQHMAHSQCMARDIAIMKIRNFECEYCNSQVSDEDGNDRIESNEEKTNLDTFLEQAPKRIIIQLDPPILKLHMKHSSNTPLQF